MLEFSDTTVDRLLGRHDDTFITVTEHQGHSSHGSGGHTSSHTTVNSRKSYSTVFEAEGKTFKFTDSDHVILEPGDRIKMVWCVRDDGLRRVLAMVNKTRGITRRYQASIFGPVFFAFFVTIFVAVFAVVGASIAYNATSSFGSLILVAAVLTVVATYALVLREIATKRAYARRVNSLLETGFADKGATRRDL